MALRRSWGPLCLALALAGSACFSCRSVDICAEDPCVQQRPDASGGTERGGASGEQPPREAGSGGELVGEGGAEQGGAFGQAGEASAAAGAAGAPSSCEPDWADCDGSTFTACETNISWHERHCGACGSVCEGVCQGKRCEPETVIWDGWATSVISSGSDAFAFVSDNAGHSLIHIDRETGEATALVASIENEWSLTVSADRVYALDPDQHQLRSARFDGTDLQLEDQALDAVSVGGTARGVYYVDRYYAPGADESVSRLWFRATGKSSWQQLHEGRYGEIVAASRYGILLKETASDESDVLLQVDGEALTDLTPSSAGLDWSYAALTASGPVLTLTDPDTGVSELVWLSEPIARYELPPASLGSSPPSVFEGEVVLLFERYGTAFIQRFGKDGPKAEMGGLASGSELRLYDTQDIWYTRWDTIATRRLSRAPWLDFNL